jgi:hypothetical protein
MHHSRFVRRGIVPLLLVSWVSIGTGWAAEPKEIARGVAPMHPQEPQVAVDAKGTIHVVFGIGDTVRYVRSDDGGRTFAKAVELPAVHAMSLGMRRGPRIAVTDSAICVTAIGGKQGKGRDGDVLAMRSADGGQTWSEGVRVNDTADSAREGLHAMAASPEGQLCCVWLDLRNRKTEIMAAISEDGGRTWGKNVLVYRSPDGSVCECCHPSVTMGRQGKVHVLFRNSLAGKRDMYVASSSDGGKTFGAATKRGRGSWALDACPMDGGAIAVGNDGEVSTIWRREKTVFLDGNSASENNLGGGEQPWIAATSDGPYTVWLKKRGEALLLRAPGNASPTELSPHANDPVIAAGPQGRGPVVAAWESRDGSKYTLHVQVVSP